MKQTRISFFLRKSAALALSICAVFLFTLPAAAMAPSRDFRHILLIGQDSTEEEPRSRADCILLCSFQPDNGTITMVSFLRDLYVEIPGYGCNRLNAAYAFGGMALLRDTLRKNFGIPIDGCVESDFSRFPQLIDLLGGVTMALRADETEEINSQNLGNPLQPGVQHLNGQQALAYARIRKLDADGDFSRTARQQALVKAMLYRFRNASVPKLLQVFRSISAIVSTDIPRGRIPGLIAELSPTLHQLNIQNQQIPTEDSYTYQTIGGMSVLVPDIQKNRLFLESILGS